MLSYNRAERATRGDYKLKWADGRDFSEIGERGRVITGHSNKPMRL